MRKRRKIERESKASSERKKNKHLLFVRRALEKRAEDKALSALCGEDYWEGV